MPKIEYEDTQDIFEQEGDDADRPEHEAAAAFSESIRGVGQALKDGDCQRAADFFSDAGDWLADVVRFRAEGAYDETLMTLWEERYKGAYDDITKECELHVELNDG